MVCVSVCGVEWRVAQAGRGLVQQDVCRVLMVLKWVKAVVVCVGQALQFAHARRGATLKPRGSVIFAFFLVYAFQTLNILQSPVH